MWNKTQIKKIKHVVRSAELWSSLYVDELHHLLVFLWHITSLFHCPNNFLPFSFCLFLSFFCATIKNEFKSPNIIKCSAIQYTELVYRDEYYQPYHVCKFILLRWIFIPWRSQCYKNWNIITTIICDSFCMQYRCLHADLFLPLFQESLPPLCCTRRGYRLFTSLCSPSAGFSPPSTSDTNFWMKSVEIKQLPLIILSLWY